MAGAHDAALSQHGGQHRDLVPIPPHQGPAAAAEPNHATEALMNVDTGPGGHPPFPLTGRRAPLSRTAVPA